MCELVPVCVKVNVQNNVSDSCSSDGVCTYYTVIV